MKLVSMKIPKRSKKEMAEACKPCPTEGERWPYGLQLRFEAEQMSKIPGLAKLKVGDKVSIQATGSVMAMRESERQGSSKDHSMEIQIEEVGVEKKGKLQKEIEDLIDNG